MTCLLPQSIQILIAVLTMFLSVSLLTPYDLTSQDFVNYSIEILIGSAEVRLGIGCACEHTFPKCKHSPVQMLTMSK